jgi:uncharacterized protein (TIGR03435 family)
LFYQVLGLNSRGEDLYDVAATIQVGATKDQFRSMLQNLLSDRFKMVVRRSTKQMQGYELVVGKNGTKMKQGSGPVAANPIAAPSEPSAPIALDSEGFPVLPAGRAGYASVKGRARMQGVNETMDQLSRKLINQLDLPVTNGTGLAGRYDYSLYWAGESAGDNSGPSLFSALESQLGLRLSSKKVVATMIVIDHVEKPSAN